MKYFKTSLACSGVFFYDVEMWRCGDVEKLNVEVGLEVGMWDWRFFQAQEEQRFCQYMAGTDEVGRGPLAGPVVSATLLVSFPLENKRVMIPFLQKLQTSKITDSKKLTAMRRQQILFEWEVDIAKMKKNECYRLVDDGPLQVCFSLAEMTPQEIDEVNILRASLLSMKKSFNHCQDYLGLRQKKGMLLIDGNYTFNEQLPGVWQRPIVKGDQKSLIIGLASILAKEYRDFYMKEMDQLYPGYGLAQHAGYPTKKHKEAIQQLGPSPIHRLTFKGVKEYAPFEKR